MYGMSTPPDEVREITVRVMSKTATAKCAKKEAEFQMDTNQTP